MNSTSSGSWVAILGLLCQPMLLADRSAMAPVATHARQGRLAQHADPSPSARGAIEGVTVGGGPRNAFNGKVLPAGGAVDPVAGVHDVAADVGPSHAPQPAADAGVSAALVERFRSEALFFRQFDIAEAIGARGDPAVLPALEDWLDHVDRHIRANVAFVFARLGDARGFDVLATILADRSDRPEGQGIPNCCFSVARQIAADRYFAARTLGMLRDPRAVPLLVPLLRDRDVNSVIPFALATIGDRRAIAPLLETLDDDDPSMRVLAIDALGDLGAKEALPRLKALLGDQRQSRFGNLISVADAARAAIAKLQ